MSNNAKKKLQYDVLFSCLDVLSRANATVSGSDPKLASDISDAIESLSGALQMADKRAEGKSDKKMDRTPSHESKDNMGKVIGSAQEITTSRAIQKYREIFTEDGENVIVDVLTNKIVYKYS